MLSPWYLKSEHPSARSLILLHQAGCFLILLGLGHLMCWLIFPSSWEGSLSIRKPILFGVSTGVTLLSLSWVASKVKPRKGDKLLWCLFALGMCLEVLLITLQYWRGEASHFNRTTPLNALILACIEVLITFATLVIIDLTWRSMTSVTSSPQELNPEQKLAIRSGMILLVLGCLLGFVADLVGHQQVAQGLSPEIFGKAGVLKFPHGVPLHVIQLLPLFCWFLERCRIRHSLRSPLLWLALFLSLIFTVLSLIQTFTGHARGDLKWLWGY